MRSQIYKDMLNKLIENDKIQKLKIYINKGAKFVILTHEMPDGDAIGSSLGLYHYLMSFDKKSIKNMITDLKKKTWPQKAEKLMDALTEHMLHSDFDEIADVVDKFLKEGPP